MPHFTPPPFGTDEFGFGWKQWLNEVFKFIEFEYHPTTVITTTYNADGEHRILLVDDDTAGAGVTITLPLANSIQTAYHVKKLGTTGNVEIQAGGGEQAVCGIAIAGCAKVGSGDLIDGTPTITIITQYDSYKMLTDGSNWHII